MTLIGFSVSSERAFVRADTECYHRLDEDEDDKRHLRGRPVGHHLKLALNQSADMASVGAGETGGNRRIAEACAFARSLDHFVAGLPTYLRFHARDRSEYLGDVPQWTCAAVGWSDRFRRMVGVTFGFRDDFRPALASAFSAPRLSDFETLDPHEPADILSYAQQQMHNLQQTTVPLAGAGSVTIAEVARHSLRVTSFDIVTGAQSPGLPNLPAMQDLDKRFAGEGAIKRSTHGQPDGGCDAVVSPSLENAGGATCAAGRFAADSAELCPMVASVRLRFASIAALTSSGRNDLARREAG